MSEENKLDMETKAGLISLAIWVEKYTAPSMRDVTDLEPLISVNKQIMQGLSGAARQSRTPAAPVASQEQFSQISI